MKLINFISLILLSTFVTVGVDSYSSVDAPTNKGSTEMVAFEKLDSISPIVLPTFHYLANEGVLPSINISFYTYSWQEDGFVGQMYLTEDYRMPPNRHMKLFDDVDNASNKLYKIQEFELTKDYLFLGRATFTIQNKLSDLYHLNYLTG